jgi:ubiquinone/menaquinone biosynthesis C-methylase UbiE
VSQETEHIELNKRMWDKRAERYDRFGYFRFFQKRALSLVHPQKNGRLLDMGCRTGWAVRYAAGLVGEGGQACGIDISPKMVERAEAASRDYKNVRFYIADAENLPFEGDYFDYIICTQSFHHYLNPVKVIGEARRVLKVGGRMYVMDPTADLFIVKWFDIRARKKSPGHVKLYSTTEFRELFNKAGLKSLKSQTIIPIMRVHIGEKEGGGLDPRAAGRGTKGGL